MLAVVAQYVSRLGTRERRFDQNEPAWWMRRVPDFCQCGMCEREALGIGCIKGQPFLARSRIVNRFLRPDAAPQLVQSSENRTTQIPAQLFIQLSLVAELNLSVEVEPRFLYQISQPFVRVLGVSLGVDNYNQR